MDRHGFAVLIVVDDSERDVDAHGIDVLKPLGDGILRFRDCSDWGARLDASQPLHGVEPVLEQVRKGVADQQGAPPRYLYLTERRRAVSVLNFEKASGICT